MECNKDEALRAMQIAEARMQSNDFTGALRFAQKAQRLYPQLENIAQMLAVSEVHCAGEKKLGSEADWYAVLKIETEADETTIKKQYKKLALLLHPDKNKFSGSEAAFKLIGEANRILTDKGKRSLYDVKRKSSVTVPNQSPATHQSPAAHQNPAAQQSSQNTSFSRQSSANVKPGNASSSENPDGSQHQQANDKDRAFSTMCPSCKVTFQYSSLFLHKSLLCRSCKKPFIAFKMDASGKIVRPQKPPTHQNDAPNNGGSSKDNHCRNHPSKAKFNVGSDGGVNVQENVNVEKTDQTEVKARNPDGNQQAEDKPFWTVCPLCKVKYQYSSLYLHKALLCPNCNKPYIAFKLDALGKIAKPQKASPNQKGVPNGGSSKDNDNHSRNHTSKSKCDAGGDGGAKVQANVKVNMHTKPEHETEPAKVKPQNPDGSQHQQAENKAFRTICPFCTVNQYSSQFLHKCHNCKKSFLAVKLDASGKTASPQKASTHQKDVPNGGSSKDNDNHSRNHSSKSKCDAGSDGGAKVQANVKVNMHTKPEHEGRAIPKTNPAKVKPQNPQEENKVFPTMCPFCRVKQYSSQFLHKCQNCKKSFLAVKLDASGKTASPQKASTHQKDVPNGGSSKDNGGDAGAKVQANAKLNMHTKPEIKGRGIPKADPTKVKPHDKGEMKSGREKRCLSRDASTHQKVIPNGGSSKDNHSRSNLSKSKCDTSSNGGAKVQADAKVQMHAKTDPVKVKPQDKGDTKSGSKKRRRDCTTDSQPKRRRNAL